MANLNSNDSIRDILNKIRTIQEGKSETRRLNLFEEKDSDSDNERAKPIAITDDPIFGTNVLSSQIEAFRSSVESGAQFSKPDKNKVEESPLIYQPSSKGRVGDNLVFSGIIPCLGNLQWQFKLRTKSGNGCFIWVDDEDGLNLTKENLDILYKLFGFYENWKDEWNGQSTDLEKLAKHINDKE